MQFTARTHTSMSFQNQEALFITYTHPSQQRKKENRKAVSSYVSRSYRPTSKKIVFPSTNFRPFILKQERPEHVSTEDAVPKSKGPQAIKSRKSIPLQPSNDLLLCSPFQDPFRSYPIPYSPYISFLSDYCKPLDLKNCTIRLLTIYSSPKPYSSVHTSTRNRNKQILFLVQCCYEQCRNVSCLDCVITDVLSYRYQRICRSTLAGIISSWRVFKITAA